VSSESGKVSTNISGSSKKQKKRQKGVRSREEEKRKQDQGLSYKTRSGKVTKPAIKFQPIQSCCNKNKCYNLVKTETQKQIFDHFYSLPVQVRVQTLCERMLIEGTETDSEGRRKTNVTHNRVVTVLYV
jgi:hypothetical protein